MPTALRAAGLVERLGLHDDGDLPVTIDSPKRDPATGIIGFPSVCKSSDTIRVEIGKLLKRGERPLVVGGCCTLLIGIGAALHEHFGPVGLAFVDGHLDCYTGQSSPTGETADMDLAILTGIGPSKLIDLGGPAPLIAPENVVVLGHRDPEELGTATVAPGITLFDVPAIRRTGPAQVGAQTARRLEAMPGRFWLHLDLDVLDQEALPAVDYRMPNGLDWPEVRELVRPLAQSPAVMGMDVTIYNPTLDPDGCHAKQIVKLLADVLGPVA